MRKNKSHFLSVIVPAYRQAKTIKKDLRHIYSTLRKIRYDFEMLVVVDGTSVDNTYKLAKELKLPKLKVLGYPSNHGKGYALRYGMARAKGDYIAFIDAGMEIDPNGISLILEHMEWYDADIIAASKYHPASQVQYPLDRKIISFGGHLIARYLLGINIRDTQAGLKIFKREVLEKVLPRLLVKDFAIDLEILAVAKHLGFKKIYEAPIKLTYAFEGLHLQGAGLKVVFHCLRDALAVFYRLKILHYYDDKNRRRWRFDKELQMKINTG